MASSSNSNNTMVLTSSDGVSFEVKEAVARKFQIIANMIEDKCIESANAIPIANITGEILSKVIEYCEKHVQEEFKDLVGETYEEKEAREKRIQTWDDEFMKPYKEDMAYMFKLILAANYLNVQGFLDLTCRTVADYIKDKSPEECREIFNLKNDFTPEEEEKILQENANDPFLQ